MGSNILLQFCLLLIIAVMQTTTNPARRAYNTADGSNFNQLVDHTKHANGNNNVEATIQEVEKLLKSNPSLPRLTRGEILDIIDNLTQVDLDQKYKESIRDQKAIMYVMPYSAENLDSENVQELYTKPPVTQIIGDSSTESTIKRRKPTKKPIVYTRPSTVTTFSTEFTPSATTEESRFTTEDTIRSTRSSTTSSTPNPVSKYKVRRRKTTTTSTTTLRPYSVEEEIVESAPSTELFTPSPVRPFRRRTTTERSKSNYPEDGIVMVSPPTYKPSFIPKTTTTTTTPPNTEDMPNDLKEVIKNLDLLIKPSQEEPSVSVDYNAQTDQEKLKALLEALGQYTTSTTTEMPEVQVAGNLTPDMKELLMSFGLIPNPNPEPVETTVTETYLEPSPEVNPESYSNFKPLPQSAAPAEGMEELLAQFGLGNRDQKAIRFSKPQNELSFEAVPDELKDVIKDIGLSKEHMVKPMVKVPEKPEHVFNPSDSEYASQDELTRLKKLMDVIKDLEKLNGTATEEDIKHIDVEGIKDLVNSFNVPLDEQNGPSPIDFDSGLNKNEVKRQQQSTTTRNPAFEALEESFGGPSASQVVTEAPEVVTEAAPRTGFYYLVDWNSFFDIDNQKGKRVNLRFQPTIGDPKRFLSVNVP